MDEQQEQQQQQKKESEKRKIRVKNTSTKGQRFIIDAQGRTQLFGPGQEKEVEVMEPDAKRLEEQSSAGSSLRIQGHEPEEPPENEAAPEIPKEQESRATLAEAERDLMEEGQEADRERREKDAKKSGEQLARETGIHMHARNIKPDVVASPPDAPPKKK